MRLTLGFTGMDSATEARLKAAFADANAQTGGRWHLVPDPQAAHVVVDMDSMYGPMSWLRLHAAGKTVIGLTASPRTQADHRLPQPVEVASLAELLLELAIASGESLESVEAATAPVSEAATETIPDPVPPTVARPVTPPAPVPVDTVGPSVPAAGLSPAPQPQHRLPEEMPAAADEEAVAPTEPAIDPVITPRDSEPPPAAFETERTPEPDTQPAGPAAPAAPATPEPPHTLLTWLTSGQLQGRVRFVRGDRPLLIDAEQRHYHGPATLKPLVVHFEGEVEAGDFESLDPAAWDSAIKTLGDKHPLTRLIWFGALLAGHGQLAAGWDPEARYQMLKWPQTEREYPRHFRIATAMMKGPTTLADLAAASGVPLADVTDFVNASLASGFADVERIPDPEPEPVKPAGLFGRLRGR